MKISPSVHNYLMRNSKRRWVCPLYYVVFVIETHLASTA